MSVYDKVLSFVKSKPIDSDFSKNDVVTSCHISMASAYNMLREMESKGIVSTFKRSKEIFYKYTGNLEDFPSISTNSNVSFLDNIGVNERFGYIETFVSMVIQGVNPSCLITGNAGVGKSYLVTKTLEKAGLKEVEDYICVKGHSSPLGLYEILHNNRDGIIVFDDCDSVFSDIKSINLLKGSLDSYNVRKISWYSNVAKNSGLEESFEFTGKIIFISNLHQEKIDNAILSRTFVIDISLSRKELLDRISAICEHIEPHIDNNTKMEVLQYLYDNMNIFSSFNIRTFIKALRIRIGIGENGDWKKMVNIMA